MPSKLIMSAISTSAAAPPTNSSLLSDSDTVMFVSSPPKDSYARQARHSAMKLEHRLASPRSSPNCGTSMRKAWAASTETVPLPGADKFQQGVRLTKNMLQPWPSIDLPPVPSPPIEPLTLGTINAPKSVVGRHRSLYAPEVPMVTWVHLAAAQASDALHKQTSESLLPSCTPEVDEQEEAEDVRAATPPPLGGYAMRLEDAATPQPRLQHHLQPCGAPAADQLRTPVRAPALAPQSARRATATTNEAPVQPSPADSMHSSHRSSHRSSLTGGSGGTSLVDTSVHNDLISDHSPRCETALQAARTRFQLPAKGYAPPSRHPHSGLGAHQTAHLESARQAARRCSSDVAAALSGIHALTPAKLGALERLYALYADVTPSGYSLARSSLSPNQWRDFCIGLLRPVGASGTGGRDALVPIPALHKLYEEATRKLGQADEGRGRPAQAMGLGPFIALLCEVATQWQRHLNVGVDRRGLPASTGPSVGTFSASATPKVASAASADPTNVFEGVRLALRLPAGLPPLLYLLDRIGRQMKHAGEASAAGRDLNLGLSNLTARQNVQRLGLAPHDIEAAMGVLCLQPTG